MKVTTDLSDCQLWVDRGLIQMYGFNHEEAIRCFQKALNFDSNCAMAYHFIAYSNAGNYNNPNGLDYAAGFKEAEKALEKANKNRSISDWEMALVKAQQHRFCWPPGSKPMEELNKNYANQMRAVYQMFGENNADVSAFFAESLMGLANKIAAACTGTLFMYTTTREECS